MRRKRFFGPQYDKADRVFVTFIHPKAVPAPFNKAILSTDARASLALTVEKKFDHAEFQVVRHFGVQTVSRELHLSLRLENVQTMRRRAELLEKCASLGI